jgi:hypothetical protein
MSDKYHGFIQYEQNVVYHFDTSDMLDAMAKLARLIKEEFPYAHGEVIDDTTGCVIYQCCQSAIC